MSDVVILAVIAAVPSVVASVFGYLSLRQGRANGAAVAGVVKATDGINSALQGKLAVMTERSEGQQAQIDAHAITEAYAATPPDAAHDRREGDR